MTHVLKATSGQCDDDASRRRRSTSAGPPPEQTHPAPAPYWPWQHAWTNLQAVEIQPGQRTTHNSPNLGLSTTDVTVKLGEDPHPDRSGLPGQPRRDVLNHVLLHLRAARRTSPPDSPLPDLILVKVGAAGLVGPAG